MKKLFSSHWVFLLLGFVFLLRLPLLFEPFTYADEGIYLTLGQAVRKGLVLYRDIHDNKPPMLYLTAAITGSFPVYRAIHFLWSFATIFIFYKLSQIVFLKNRKAVIISTSTFAILTSLHTFEGNIANAENFMLLPTLIAFFLIFKFINKPASNQKFLKCWFLIGILLSLAVLFKVPAIFDFFAALIFIFLIFLDQKQKNYLLFPSLLIGFLLPILITALYFAYKNALSQYLTAAFLQNLPYLSSWGGGSPKIGELPILLLSRVAMVFLLIIFLFIFRKKICLNIKFILLWFSFSLFAALLSSRPYPHYLIQVLPSFSLAFGFWTLTKAKTLLKLIPTSLTLIFILTFASFRFWYYPNLPYLANFYQFAVGIKSRQDYLNYFGGQTKSLYETASFIKNHTDKKEKIFIWGTQPSLYSLTNRLPVGRYTVAYHIIDFDGYRETMLALTNKPPRWIIVTPDEKKSFPQLENLLDYDYTLYKKIGENKIFYRIPKISRL